MRFASYVMHEESASGAPVDRANRSVLASACARYNIADIMPTNVHVQSMPFPRWPLRYDASGPGGRVGQEPASIVRTIGRRTLMDTSGADQPKMVCKRLTSRAVSHTVPHVDVDDERIERLVALLSAFDADDLVLPAYLTRPIVTVFPKGDYL